MPSRLTVVHRSGCELCDEMLRDLEDLRARAPLPAVDVVDVDADAQLARRHRFDVPVLLLDGTVVCRHRLDVGELLRLLRAEDKAEG